VSSINDMKVYSYDIYRVTINQYDMQRDRDVVFDQSVLPLLVYPSARNRRTAKSWTADSSAGAGDMARCM
jgi:hypothetical protein